MQRGELKTEEYQPVCNFVCDTYDRIKENGGISEELRSAMKEFSEKSQELMDKVQTQDTVGIKECLIEVEQAADSALRVARASDEADDAVETQIKEAHDRIRDLKEQVLH